MNNLDTTLIVAIICGILFPAYVLLTGKKTIGTLEKHPGRLTFVYKETIILLILMAVLVIGSMNIEQKPVKIIGLEFIYQPIWILLLFAASIASFFLTKRITIPESKAESIGKGLEGVQHILPKNPEEYKWAVRTSFVAGVCEEIIFRGFLFWQLNQVMHDVFAVLIANLLFGIAHAATRLNNAIKAFGLGLLFSILYLVTGSLWLPILAHIIVDLYAMSISFIFSEMKAGR